MLQTVSYEAKFVTFKKLPSITMFAATFAPAWLAISFAGI